MSSGRTVELLPHKCCLHGGGCQSGWGRLLSVTNAIEAGIWCQGDSGWAYAGRPGERGRYLCPLQCIPALSLGPLDRVSTAAQTAGTMQCFASFPRQQEGGMCGLIPNSTPLPPLNNYTTV